MYHDGTVVSDTAGALRGRLSAGRGLSALEAGESRGRDKMDEGSAPGGEHECEHEGALAWDRTFQFNVPDS